MEIKGYECNAEYIEDLFHMLDAFLEVGIQVLENEEQYVFEFREQLQQIQKEIEEREKQTRSCLNIPFLQMCQEKKMSRFVKFCFILGWAAMENKNHRECFSRLQEGGRWYASKGLAVFLYQQSEAVKEKDFYNLRIGTGFWNTCFCNMEDSSGFQSWREEPVLLYPEFQQMVYGTRLVAQEMAQLGNLWEYTEPLGKLLFREEQKNRMSFLMGNHADGQVIMLTGKQGSGRLLTLKHVLKAQEKNLLLLDGARLEHEMEEKEESILQAIKSVKLVYGAEICIAAAEKVYTSDQIRTFEKIIAAAKRLFLISESPVEFSAFYAKNQIEIYMPEPRLKEKTGFWQYFMQQYPHQRTADAEMLGNRYMLNGGEINQVLKNAFLTAQSKGMEMLEEEDITQAVRAYNKSRPDMPAQRIDTVYTWGDLVVEKKTEERLRHICNQIKYRGLVGESWGFYHKRPYGRGISALFYGPPGTGKTMAAQVIAQELGVDLYRVDISRMMSKYIGETQKNMTQLFEWAKDSNALLFFDEADALFHRRTEVSDANDRHANSEVAHLLQQLEEYEGIVILATNLKENIDDAFKRRIKGMIGFKLPDVEIRKRLWKKLLPEQAPVETDLALDFFAEQFELSGSEIKEVMMQAAFLAAAQETEIGNQQIWEALEMCYEKYGRRLGKEEFEFLW